MTNATLLILWIIAGAIQLIAQKKYHKKAEWLDYWLLYIALIAHLIDNFLK
jgi:hypothetical protein